MRRRLSRFLFGAQYTRKHLHTSKHEGATPHFIDVVKGTLTILIQAALC
jgi:hypothetical protein